MTSVDLDGLVNIVEAARLLGCSKATFWRRVADGTVPRPIKIGGMSRWPRSEILHVIRLAQEVRDVASRASAAEARK